MINDKSLWHFKHLAGSYEMRLLSRLTTRYRLYNQYTEGNLTVITDIITRSIRELNGSQKSEDAPPFIFLPVL